MVKPNRVTARDVAVRAGVSPATVSKALSGRGAVHPDTRDRILVVARELDFKSPHLGRLDATSPRTVGLVTRDPFGRRTAPVLLGAVEALAERDIAVLVCDGRADLIREQYFVDSLLQRRVDGILVAGGPHGSFTRPPLRGDVAVPVVYMMSASTDPDDISVVPDDSGACRLATHHLVETGRRHIACILGPQREEAAKAKTAATTAALAEHGLSLVTDVLFGHWNEQWGRQAALQLLRADGPLDGIVCGNDLIARGAIAALQEAGLSVPGDVAVVGFDNYHAMVEGSRPQLTSIDLNLAEVGRVAAAELIRSIDAGRPRPGATTTIECQLVPRESTAVTAASTTRRSRRH